MIGTWRDAYTGEPYPPIERDAESLEVTGGMEYDTAQLPLLKRLRMAWMAITGRTICIRVGVIHVTTKSKGDVCSAEQPSDSPG